MTVLITIALAIIIGWLRRGSLNNFSDLRFKYPLIGLAGLWMQVIVINTDLRQLLKISPYEGIIYSLAYLMVFVFFLLNWALPGFSLVAAGCLLNTLVISLNNGQMPLSATAARLAGQMTLYSRASSTAGKMWTTYTQVSDQTQIFWLGDIIPIPKPFPVPTVISIGDIFILIGIFWLIQKVMLEKQDTDTR